ncbi:unnamed protein product, partial [Adineta ricciae]
MPSRFSDIEPLNTKQAIDNYLLCKIVPLSEAIIPILHIVTDILVHINIAKLACQTPSDNLTQDESASIYLYTMNTEFYFKINKALRTNVVENIKPWFLYLKLFHTALNKLPSQKERVWRGIVGNFRSQYTKGTRFVWTGVSSTSSDIGMIEHFLPNNKHTTIFSINCLYGKSVTKHSAIPDEQEIILMPGTKLIVNGILKKHLHDIIDLKEEINPNFINSLTILPAIKVSVKKDDSCPTSPKAPLPKKPKVVLPPIKSPQTKETVQDNSEPQRTLVCPHCQEKNTYSHYKQGSISTCYSCKGNFKQVTCPHCQKTNYCKNSQAYASSRSVDCANCQKSFQQLNCPHCNQCNYFLNANYIEGNTVNCCTCKKPFQVMICTHCSSENIWQNANHVEGSRVKCSNCKKDFQKVNCPHCQARCSWKNADYLPGTRTSCGSCKKIFQCVNCFHCKTPLKWLKSEYEQGIVVKCTSCSKKFQQINCPHCKVTNWYRNADYVQGSSTRCSSCKEKFQLLACPNCSTANILKGTTFCHGKRQTCFR